MTTVLLHTGQTAPILEPRQPEMRVVRGGKHGLNRARQFADQSQITYIQLEEQSVIEKTGSDAGRVLVGIRTAALNLLDSFNP